MKRVIHQILLLLLRLYRATGAHSASQRARSSTLQTPRVLLLHPSPLGALILTTPALHALKTQVPDAHITMMVGSWASEVVAHHPAIDRPLVSPFPSYRRISPKGFSCYLSLFRLARRLKRGHYDLALTLHRNFWWVTVLIYLVGIPRRVGYAVAPGTSFLTHAVAFRSQERVTNSQLAVLSAGLQALGSSSLPEPYTPEHYPMQVESTEEEQHWVTRRLRAERIAEVSALVAIHPSTSVAVRQWRSEARANCATALSTCCSGRNVHFLLTGTERELPLLQEIARDSSARTTILTEATVGQLAALLGRCQLVLGLDSGPLHLAAALRSITLHLRTDRSTPLSCLGLFRTARGGHLKRSLFRVPDHPVWTAAFSTARNGLSSVCPARIRAAGPGRHSPALPSLLDDTLTSVTDVSSSSREDDSRLREELSPRWDHLDISLFLGG